MNALVLLAVLGTGQVAASDETTGVKWLSDYGVALKAAREQGRPLLIVIDRPGDAVGRISQISHSEAGPADDLKHYVLCRVDADTAYGKAVVKAFEAASLPHTAIIDKAGEYILFAKAGQFSSQEWTTTLAKYRTGVRPVSYRSAREEVFSGYSGYGYGGYGGSYCPSCSRGR